MLDPLIGTIMPWAPNFEPVGWFRCDGRTLSIQQYQALYSLIGVTYGGDGSTTFKLPDLSACVPMGSGYTSIGQLDVGKTVGTDLSQMAINTNTMPAHSHTLNALKVNVPGQSVEITWKASEDLGDRPAPLENDYLGGIPVEGSSNMFLYRDTLGQSVNLSGVSGTVPALNSKVSGEVSVAGKGENIQISNFQPVLGLHFIIAYDGIYPMRP